MKNCHLISHQKKNTKILLNIPQSDARNKINYPYIKKHMIKLSCSYDNYNKINKK